MIRCLGRSVPSPPTSITLRLVSDKFALLNKLKMPDAVILLYSKNVIVVEAIERDTHGATNVTDTIR
jgi:hypothetical protein